MNRGPEDNLYTGHVFKHQGFAILIECLAPRKEARKHCTHSKQGILHFLPSSMRPSRGMAKRDGHLSTASAGRPAVRAEPQGTQRQRQETIGAARVKRARRGARRRRAAGRGGPHPPRSTPATARAPALFGRGTGAAKGRRCRPARARLGLCSPFRPLPLRWPPLAVHGRSQFRRRCCVVLSLCQPRGRLAVCHRSTARPLAKGASVYAVFRHACPGATRLSAFSEQLSPG